MVDPLARLTAGAHLLEPVLLGFDFSCTGPHYEPEGHYVVGTFAAGDRAITFVYRFTLLGVRWSKAGKGLEHAEVMARLGVRGRYPGFQGRDPMDAFRDVASDVREHGRCFTDGDGEGFARLVVQGRGSQP